MLALEAVYWTLSILNAVVSYLAMLPLNILWLRRLNDEKTCVFVRVRGKSVSLLLLVALLIVWIPIPLMITLCVCGDISTAAAFEWYAVITLIIISYCYGFRNFRTWFALVIRKIKADQQWRHMINPGDHNIWVKYNHVFKSKQFQLIVGALIYIGLALFSYYVTHNLHIHTQAFAIAYFNLIWIGIFYGSITLIFLIWILSISRFDDAYKFRIQVIIESIGFSAILAIFCTLTVWLKARDNDRESVLFTLGGFQWGLLWMAYFGAPWVLIQQRISDVMADEKGKEDSVSLDKLSKTAYMRTIERLSKELKHTVRKMDSFRALAAFLVSEVSCENLVFLVELLQYKAAMRRMVDSMDLRLGEFEVELADYESEGVEFHIWNDIRTVSWLPKNRVMHPSGNRGKDTLSMVAYIRDKYIDNAADLALNLSFDVRTRILDRVNRVLNTELLGQNKILEFTSLLDEHSCYTMFDRAYEEIWNLLKGDSFRRFRRTVEYQSFQKRVSHMAQNTITVQSGSMNELQASQIIIKPTR